MMPWTVGCRPSPVKVARPPGAISGPKLAQFGVVMLPTPSGGTISEKVAATLPETARMVTGPLVAPAVTKVEARPVSSAATEVELRVADPLLTENVTVAKEAGF